MKKNNKGFTLVELLVVIAIIGILAVVAVPTLFKNIEKGKIADLEADISAIRSAALSVYADTSQMPQEIIIGKIDQSNNLINAELEGLSNPFKATEYKTSIDENEDLILTITTSNQISKSGKQKLKQDLGDKLVGVESDTTTDNDKTPLDIITVRLISK